MSQIEQMRVFVSQRLNAAVEEILAAFEKTVVKYEQEAAQCHEVISRQHALLCALNRPLMDSPHAGEQSWESRRYEALFQVQPPSNQEDFVYKVHKKKNRGEKNVFFL